MFKLLMDEVRFLCDVAAIDMLMLLVWLTDDTVDTVVGNEGDDDAVGTNNDDDGIFNDPRPVDASVRCQSFIYHTINISK
jgi:hypothetical protein